MLNRACKPSRALLVLLFAPFAPAAAQELATAPTQLGDSCRAPEARQFDFWIGEWDVANWQRHPTTGQSGMTGTATMKGYLILDGCAFVEHWQGRTGGGRTFGFSVRAFDPTKQRWVILLNWPGHNRPSFSTLEGEFRDGRAEFLFDFTGRDDTPTTGRFTFSDITANSLRWEQAFSIDGRRTWSTSWIMEFTRRPPGAVPLFNGPALLGHNELLCAGQEARGADFLVGDWELSGAGQTDTAAAVRVSVFPILAGCAQMEFREIGAASRKEFRVRSFIGAAKEWQQYRIMNADPVFRRGTGAAGEDEIVLTDDEEKDGRLLRERWRKEGSSKLQVLLEVSTDGGASWQALRTISLRRRL